jgi:hypothetical protein
MMPTSHIHFGACGSLLLPRKPRITAASATRNPNPRAQEKTSPARPRMNEVRLMSLLGPATGAGA